MNARSKIRAKQITLLARCPQLRPPPPKSQSQVVQRQNKCFFVYENKQKKTGKNKHIFIIDLEFMVINNISVSTIFYLPHHTSIFSKKTFQPVNLSISPSRDPSSSRGPVRRCQQALVLKRRYMLHVVLYNTSKHLLFTLRSCKMGLKVGDLKWPLPPSSKRSGLKFLQN